MSEVLWKLPVPATALLGSPILESVGTRTCRLSFAVSRADGDQEVEQNIALQFEGVEAYKCTYLTSCRADMFELAYGKLIRLGKTPWQIETSRISAAAGQCKELHHLMICFDDGPCYEVICSDFSCID
jgi:hypothetical protein